MAAGATRSAKRPVIEHATVPIGSIVKNPRNPRRHPDEQIERLAASIKRFGQPRDVLVRKANHMIVAGHGVTDGCKLAGLGELNVVLWDVDQDTADAFMLGDNRLGQLGEDDDGQIRALLREMGMLDPASIGFSAPEIDDLLKDGEDELEVVELATSTVSDRFWISIRGPLYQQAAVLQLLHAGTADMPNVVVELGTQNDV
jgi:ParB-like chromosome segregation protein Spo0J